MRTNRKLLPGLFILIGMHLLSIGWIEAHASSSSGLISMPAGDDEWHRGPLRTAATPTRVDPSTDLDAFIIAKLAEAHMPGLSAAIIKNGQTVWTGAYGWSRVYQGVPVTPDTLFMLASVSKTITAVAVMQVVEYGLLALDQDINTYLPFAVVNPTDPITPLTVRMLLTHTSAIRDNWLVLQHLYQQGDSPIPLGQFLPDYLTPGGRYYFPQVNFHAASPGTVYDYCNVAVSLAAYLVEAVTGIPFDEFCNTFIFAPLAMTETSWRLADLDKNHIAMPYGYVALVNRYYPYGFYGYPDYPDGGLRTSAGQLANFLAMFIGGGQWQGVRLLKPETVAEMQRIQYPDLAADQGLTWYTKELNGWTLLGHNGGDKGVATEMFFRPADGVGVILQMNGDWSSQFQSVYDIETRLFLEADKY